MPPYWWTINAKSGWSDFEFLVLRQGALHYLKPLLRNPEGSVFVVLVLPNSLCVIQARCSRSPRGFDFAFCQCGCVSLKSANSIVVTILVSKVPSALVSPCDSRMALRLHSSNTLQVLYKEDQDRQARSSPRMFESWLYVYLDGPPMTTLRLRVWRTSLTVQFCRPRQCC